MFSNKFDKAASSRAVQKFIRFSRWVPQILSKKAEGLCKIAIFIVFVLPQIYPRCTANFALSSWLIYSCFKLSGASILTDPTNQDAKVHVSTLCDLDTLFQEREFHPFRD